MIVERGRSLVMEVIFFLFRCGVIDFRGLDVEMLESNGVVDIFVGGDTVEW